MRRDLPKLVAMVAGIAGVRDVGLTTNGVFLADQAQALYDAGLRRLNVSLDTLDPGRFRAARPARRAGPRARRLGRGQAGRVRADQGQRRRHPRLDRTRRRAAGPVRRDRTASSCGSSSTCRSGPRLGARQGAASADEILATIEREVGPLAPAGDADPHAPAMDFDYADGGGRVGVIASVSRPFCRTCNRLRLTADGKLRNCLFALDETDVKGLLRGGRGRRGARGRDRGERGGQVGGARDQHGPVREAGRAPCTPSAGDKSRAETCRPQRSAVLGCFVRSDPVNRFPSAEAPPDSRRLDRPTTLSRRVVRPARRRVSRRAWSVRGPVRRSS